MICALLGAIVWDLLTWWFGLAVQFEPCADWRFMRRNVGHLASNWQVIIWSQPNLQHWYQGKGCCGK